MTREIIIEPGATTGKQYDFVYDLYGNVLSKTESTYTVATGATTKKVCNYDEYVLSQCSFVVLVTDDSCIEIYTKDDEDCMKFIRNAKCCEGKDIKIKTESNDGRTTFLIS